MKPSKMVRRVNKNKIQIVQEFAGTTPILLKMEYAV